MALRDQILATELPREVVPCPEWGMNVYVRMMTGTEREEYEASVRGNKKYLRARLAVFCVVDETGTRVFTEADVEALSEKGAAPLSRIFDKAAKLNRLLNEDVEELAKN